MGGVHASTGVGGLRPYVAAVPLAGAVDRDEVARSGFLTAMNETYRVRRDRTTTCLQELGFAVRRPRATRFPMGPLS